MASNRERHQCKQHTQPRGRRRPLAPLRRVISVEAQVLVPLSGGSSNDDGNGKKLKKKASNRSASAGVMARTLSFTHTNFVRLALIESSWRFVLS